MKPIHRVYITGVVVVGVLLVVAYLLSIDGNGVRLWVYVEHIWDSLGDFGSQIKGIFDGTIRIDALLDLGFRSI